MITIAVDAMEAETMLPVLKSKAVCWLHVNLACVFCWSGNRR